MTFASRPATKDNLRLWNDSSNEFLTRSNVKQQRVSHSFRRAPHSFQIRSPTSVTLVPTSFVLVPNSPPTSLTLVSTSFALGPDSQLTVAIDRGQATTVLSEHHNKEQRKRTQRRSATMFAVPTRNTVFLTTMEKGCGSHIITCVHSVKLKAMCHVQVWRVDGQTQTKNEKKNGKKKRNLKKKKNGKCLMNVEDCSTSSFSSSGDDRQ